MTREEQFNDHVSRVKVKSRHGNKVQAFCPCHNDKHASLTMTMGRKCTLIYDHAGCCKEDIVQAMGMQMRDLFYDVEPRSPNWKAYVEGREKHKIEAIYNYVSINGSYAFTKIRLEGKKIIYGKLQNDRFTYGLGHDVGRKSYKAIYGSLQAINKAIAENRPIFIPEGEKDADTLIKQGYTAFAYGGVNDWQSDFATLVQGADVYILADNDEAGKRVAETIQNDIKAVAKSSKIIVPMPDMPKADVSDYFAEGHNKQEFEQMLEQERNTVKETVRECTVTHSTPIEPQKRQDSHLEQVLKDLHAERYETSDKGFGRLFADVFKDRHRYNPSRKDFMRYDGKRWIDDIEGLGARASAKVLSDALVRYAVNVDTEGKYLKAVAALCNIRNRNNMLQDSKDVYFFSNEQLDVNDYLLNVQNGTLDLSGNEPVFLNHSPDMLLSKICNAEYDPAADCKEWKKFLLEIMQDDKEKISYLQKIAGLSLTGNTEQETCFILYGSTTRNGKSTFCETLIHLLGDYAVTMKPESLAVRQNLDSRTASGDIARLAGCRFCNASEPPKRMLFDTALLKSLLGRDSITARHLYQRETTFIPKFKLVINTNFLPTITDDTVFSSGRINVISFDRHFEPQEQDKDLKNRLRDKQELSGILNWCIEGLQLYRKEGLKPPAAVQTATDTYRTDSDKIGNFINECLTKTEQNSKAKDIYEVYARWCEENGFGVENKSNFFAELKTKGLFANSGTVDGKTVKNVVKGYTVETEFIEYRGQESLPFD